MNKYILRDQFAENILRKEINFEEKIILHIEEFGHIFAKYDNLYDRLKDLNPKRIKLCDVDKISTIEEISEISKKYNNLIL